MTTTAVAASTAAAPATVTSAELGADVTRVAAKGTTWCLSEKPSAEGADVAARRLPAPCVTLPPAHFAAIDGTAAAGAVAVVSGTAEFVPAAVSATGTACEDASTTPLAPATEALGAMPATDARAHWGICPSPSATDVA